MSVFSSKHVLFVSPLTIYHRYLRSLIFVVFTLLCSFASLWILLVACLVVSTISTAQPCNIIHKIPHGDDEKVQKQTNMRDRKALKQSSREQFEMYTESW
jgi:hypothetical protein